MAPAAVLVNIPAFEIAIVTGPPLVVVMAAPRTTELVVTEIPKAPVVVSAPLKVVVRSLPIENFAAEIAKL